MASPTASPAGASSPHSGWAATAGPSNAPCAPRGALFASPVQPGGTRSPSLFRGPYRAEEEETAGGTVRWNSPPTAGQRAAELADREPVRVDYPQKELIARLLTDTCEICGSKGNVQVHHVRALADLAHAGWQPSDWARVMLHRCRETVVACDTCHDRIHSERPARPLAQ
ncbi:HNH endonuclease [Streptomyces marianii]|uniref:HNH endonuclease n=1 Tax=Streptomyces marianii TaxID=1817406 RepID=UPI002D771064|nr:hypothetical protein [Streptomyces marianii]